MVTNVYGSNFTIAKKWEQLVDPLKDAWINKTWHTISIQWNIIQL